MNSGLARTSTSRADRLTDALGSPRLWAFQAAFLAALSLSAFVRIPLPFTPVPVTLQLFVVFLAALFLGGRASLPVVGGYLALGAAGVPVFSGGAAGLGHLFGATGGYLLGFLLAAWVVGTWIHRPATAATKADLPDPSDSSDRSDAHSPTELTRLRRDAAVLALGLLLVYGPGSLWLVAVTGPGVGSVLAMAVFPFVLVDAIKVATAYSLYRLAGRTISRFLA